jgi:hypothetical protein
MISGTTGLQDAATLPSSTGNAPSRPGGSMRGTLPPFPPSSHRGNVAVVRPFRLSLPPTPALIPHPITPAPHLPVPPVQTPEVIELSDDEDVIDLTSDNDTLYQPSESEEDTMEEMETGDDTNGDEETDEGSDEDDQPVPVLRPTLPEPAPDTPQIQAEMAKLQASVVRLRRLSIGTIQRYLHPNSPMLPPTPRQPTPAPEVAPQPDPLAAIRQAVAEMEASLRDSTSYSPNRAPVTNLPGPPNSFQEEEEDHVSLDGDFENYFPEEVPSGPQESLAEPRVTPAQPSLPAVTLSAEPDSTVVSEEEDHLSLDGDYESYFDEQPSRPAFEQEIITAQGELWTVIDSTDGVQNNTPLSAPSSTPPADPPVEVKAILETVVQRWQRENGLATASDQSTTNGLVTSSGQPATTEPSHLEEEDMSTLRSAALRELPAPTPAPSTSRRRRVRLGARSRRRLQRRLQEQIRLQYLETDPLP